MFNKIINNTYLLLAARIVVGLMFIIVGIGKISNAAEFAKEIGNYAILPEQFLNITAISVAWIELLIGFFFLFGVEIKASGLLIFLLLFVFTTAVIIAMAKGLNINCGCYSNIASQKVGMPKVLENTGMMLLTLIVLFSKNEKWTMKYGQ